MIDKITSIEVMFADNKTVGLDYRHYPVVEVWRGMKYGGGHCKGKIKTHHNVSLASVHRAIRAGLSLVDEQLTKP